MSTPVTSPPADRLCPAGGTGATVGELLQAWRHQHRMSQMTVAHAAGISPRHLSFVETGKANASRKTLTDLADALHLTPHDRNTLMLAAGYAPPHPRTDWADPTLAAVRAALTEIVDLHDPMPAMAIDLRGDVLHANNALLRLIDQPGPAGPPVNVYDLILSPDGLGDRIVNRDAWTTHMTNRLHQRANQTRNPHLLALASRYPRSGHERLAPDLGEPMLPLVLRHEGHQLRLASLRTYLTEPHDLTLAEISLETFIPLDRRTRSYFTQ